jgi:NADPH2:quinone reductase
VVAAAGVHLIDTKLRSGVRMGPLPVPELPAIPGREVAGVVDTIGPGVAESWLGRRVVAHLGAASGGYAELAVRVHVLPDGVADDIAVAMIGTGRTAMAILDAARIEDDDVVLDGSTARPAAPRSSCWAAAAGMSRMAGLPVR